MALETLKNVKEIGGFKVVDMDALRTDRPDMFRPDGSMHYHLFEKEIRPHNFIYVRHDVNSISFTIQNGPVKENGVNGCQVDTLIETAKEIIDGLNIQFPCDYNYQAIEHLEQALDCLAARRQERECRDVEGKSLA
jgi:hypothetical protein